MPVCPVFLSRLGISVLESATKLTAKVDTGSTDCIFARKHGEQLGLSIEEGERVQIGTATGSFSTYGILLH